MTIKVKQTIFVNLDDIVIGTHLIRPIEEIMNEMKKNPEELEDMGSSIETTGQIHPLYVRIINSKYELISGGRRYVAAKHYSKLKKLEAKVVEASELDARELAHQENQHRKNQDSKIRDTEYYITWKMGKKEGRYKSEADFAKMVSLRIPKIKEIIAGELKDEFKDNVVIQNATTADITATKPLSLHPEIREKVLDRVQKKEILNKDIVTVSKDLKESIDTGTGEDNVTKVIDLMVSKNTETDNIDDSDPVRFQPEKLKDFLGTIKDSPQDVVDKFVEGKISVEVAKAAKDFETSKAREQIIAEVRKKEEKKNTTQDVAETNHRKGLQGR